MKSKLSFLAILTAALLASGASHAAPEAATLGEMPDYGRAQAALATGSARSPAAGVPLAIGEVADYPGAQLAAAAAVAPPSVPLASAARALPPGDASTYPALHAADAAVERVLQAGVPSGRRVR